MSSGKARLLADPRDYDPESEPLLDKDDDDDKGGTSASVRGRQSECTRFSLPAYLVTFGSS